MAMIAVVTLKFIVPAASNYLHTAASTKFIKAGVWTNQK